MSSHGVYKLHPVPEPKVWGQTSPLVREYNASLHFIEAKAGGFCSIHLHAHKRNVFYVLSGTLLVRVWQGGGKPKECKEYRLEAGDVLGVAPGRRHQFEAITDVKAIEMYTVGPLNEGDIERFKTGGARC